MVINIKSVIGAACACLSVVSLNASAAIISTDWNAVGDNLVTQVTGAGPGSGLEWLDLTATIGRSYNDISTKLGAGQEFDSWRYATLAEVSDYFDAFGGDNAYYSTGFSTQNNLLFDAIAPFWGDTTCAVIGCGDGEGSSYFILADSLFTGSQIVGYIYDDPAQPLSATNDYIELDFDNYNTNATNTTYGSALVRITVVPVPAAVWLFGSGLMGLIGVARRKNK